MRGLNSPTCQRNGPEWAHKVGSPTLARRAGDRDNGYGRRSSGLGFWKIARPRRRGFRLGARFISRCDERCSHIVSTNETKSSSLEKISAIHDWLVSSDRLRYTPIEKGERVLQLVAYVTDSANDRSNFENLKKYYLQLGD